MLPAQPQPRELTDTWTQQLLGEAQTQAFGLGLERSYLGRVVAESTDIIGAQRDSDELAERLALSLELVGPHGQRLPLERPHGSSADLDDQAAVVEGYAGLVAGADAAT